jgi:hypothetical protein
MCFFRQNCHLDDQRPIGIGLSAGIDNTACLSICLSLELCKSRARSLLNRLLTSAWQSWTQDSEVIELDCVARTPWKETEILESSNQAADNKLGSEESADWPNTFLTFPATALAMKILCPTDFDCPTRPIWIINKVRRIGWLYCVTWLLPAALLNKGAVRFLPKSVWILSKNSDRFIR